MDSIRLPTCNHQITKKGLQLYTTSDTKFSVKQMFVNVIEDICSLVNIRTYTERVTFCKFVA